MDLREYLACMQGFDQKSKYHELDLWEHTMCAVGRARSLNYPNHVIEALCWHDVGKLTVYTVDDYGFQHYEDHATASAKEYYENSLDAYDPEVHQLILYHDKPITRRMLNTFEASMPPDTRMQFVENLLRVKECDAYAQSDYSIQKNAERRAQEIVLVRYALRKWNIQQHMAMHYAELVSRGYEVVGLFLQGSQNYNLDDSRSDVDTKAIVLPTLAELLGDKSPVSTLIVLDNNEHIDVKDIRAMFDCFTKSNINFLEIMFTKYRILNPKYSRLLSPVFIEKERLALYDKLRLLNACCGMSDQKYKAMKHPYPSTEEAIKRYGYDPKQLHHILRLNEFAQRIIAGESFNSCLISNDTTNLVAIKRGKLTLEEAEAVALECSQNIHTIKREWEATNEHVVDTDALLVLNKVKYEILMQWFKESLMV